MLVTNYESLSPLVYFVELFGNIAGASVSLAILLSIVTHMKWKECIRCFFDTPIYATRAQWRLRLFFLKYLGIFTFIFLRSFPEALWLMLWGEVSSKAAHNLLWISHICDGVSVALLFIAVISWAWENQLVEEDKQRYNLDDSHIKPSLIGVPSRAIIQNVRIIVLVFIIAAGVALGKVYT